MPLKPSNSCLLTSLARFSLCIVNRGSEAILGTQDQRSRNPVLMTLIFQQGEPDKQGIKSLGAGMFEAGLHQGKGQQGWRVRIGEVLVTLSIGCWGLH